MNRFISVYFILLLVPIFFLSCTKQKKSTIGVKTLEPKEFVNLYQSTDNAVLVDLRTQDEVKRGALEDALQIDYLGEDFSAKSKDLDPEKTYFLFCAGGYRSQQASQDLQQLGFQHIVNLDGGFSDLKKHLTIKE